MRIDLLEGAFVKKQWARHFSPSINEEVEKQVKELLEQGFIRPSNSSVSAPVVPIRKPDGTTRVCIDYRDLNKWTLEIRYPLPLISEKLKILANKKYFAKLDLRSGFWQLPIDEDCKWLTAFVTLSGLYEWNRLPFGPKNGPSVFQSRMHDILHGLEDSMCVTFMDDILIFGNDWHEFLCKLNKVLKRLDDYNATVKITKCSFDMQEVEYLGTICNSPGIKLSRVEAVQNTPVPKTLLI
ncbi:MAG: reverse transcriptase family protein [Leptospiraceae bacterium]|nr:reverse transcriptase family protein [Leptospiraceae bacterium]